MGNDDILITVPVEGILERKWVLLEYVGVPVVVRMDVSDKVT